MPPLIPFPAVAIAPHFPQASGFAFIDGGGFKTVYRIHIAGGSDEVLKIIRLPKDDGSEGSKAYRRQELGRAMREITLLGKLKSPHIVRLGSIAPCLCQIGEEECVAYSEELLPGRDLAKVLREMKTRGLKPTESDVKCLMRSLILAIQELWGEYRSIHRDIKPANIFVTGLPERPYVLLDFGIAYDLNEPGLTLRKDHAPGTLLYLAPEMCDLGFRDTISYRSDLYSTALSVFEFASGGVHALAEPGDDLVRTVSRVIRQEPAKLAVCRPDLSTDLAAMIDQLLKKKPALRPGSFALLLTKLA